MDSLFNLTPLAAEAPLDLTRMANLLEISGEAFDRIKAAITSNVNAKSGAIQADLIESFSYNQICFVLASDQRACYVNVEKRGRGGGGRVG